MMRTWTEAELRALGARTDLVTAGSVLGIGRTAAYDLAQRGEFPVTVVRIGRKYVVPVNALLRLLELDGAKAPDDPKTVGVVHHIPDRQHGAA